jgi:hypothetical protein
MSQIGVLGASACKFEGCPQEINLMEDFEMQLRKILSITSMGLFSFSTVAWSATVAKGVLSAPAENQSVKGRISAIGDAQFSVDTIDGDKTNTVQFMIDDHTKMDGKLTVGAQAAVDYRVDGNTMIATHVVVMPTSGIDK